MYEICMYKNYFKVCAPEEVKKCRWVVRNVNKQVDEKVCTDVVREVSVLLSGAYL